MSHEPERYARFNAAVAECAGNWASDRLVPTHPSGTKGLYFAAGSQFVKYVMTRLPRHERTQAIWASSEVIAHFSFMMALVARKHELDQHELTSRMRSGETFRTLATAARVPGSIAMTFEHMIGMRQGDFYGKDAAKVALYELGETGFAFRDADALIRESIVESDSGVAYKDRLSGKCPGLLNGSIRAHFNAFVTVADSDPRLFAATLAADSINGV